MIIISDQVILSVKYEVCKIWSKEYALILSRFKNQLFSGSTEHRL